MSFTTFPIHRGIPRETPHYPNVYKAFNNKLNIDDELENDRLNIRMEPRDHGGKKVHTVEKEVECDKNGNSKGYEEAVIDALADGFIQEKRKAFELCKTSSV